VIELTAKQREEIASHGEQDYPYECCGALLGLFGSNGLKRVVETYRISNEREEAAKRNRFLIRPEELIKAERYAHSKDLEVIGFYHSHPDHPAVPSQYDLEHAWPIYSYIVVSVAAGHAGDIRSWEQQPDRARFNEEEILKGG
jgi:proteasome lid subunit RPN8/RPN11